VKTIAAFNCRAGVGKTSLVYHLGHMLSRLGYPTLMVDLDPQMHLTSSMWRESDLEGLLADSAQGKSVSILASMRYFVDGLSTTPPENPPAGPPWLLAGDINLLRYEPRLGESWSRGLTGDKESLNTLWALSRAVQQAAGHYGATVTLLDLGPGVSAINQAALLAADSVLVPMLADPLALEGLKLTGEALRTWREQWQQVRQQAGSSASELPEGRMDPLGYVLVQSVPSFDTAARDSARWLESIPSIWRQTVLGQPSEAPPISQDEYCLALLRSYRSLAPMAQEARRPMFDLRPADGALGSYAQAVRLCVEEYEALARKIAQR
jgi:chromosome partitioning protein